MAKRRNKNIFSLNHIIFQFFPKPRPLLSIKDLKKTLFNNFKLHFQLLLSEEGFYATLVSLEAMLGLTILSNIKFYLAWVKGKILLLLE